ncbi:Type 1 glutamine amidotransferase-like domain-containing protein, partial [Patescibacteria group bacterium]|nr:Type 1 glutamine amidotransferase-like domain-containing protein [Patescibacteria group bacterium]
YSLQQSELSEMLPELLKTRIYVGISAGSMVTARHLTLSDSLKLYSEDIGKIKIDHGLGFVDFQIKPHFNCKDFPNVNAKILKEISNGKGNIVYAIDDNTAIKVDDDKISIISEGQWEKFS